MLDWGEKLKDTNYVSKRASKKYTDEEKIPGQHQEGSDHSHCVKSITKEKP